MRIVLVHIFYSVVILLTLRNEICFALPSCKNDNGDDVDWFVMLKLPKIKGDSVKPVTQGVGYYYADSTDDNFKLSNLGVDDPNSCIGRTAIQALNGQSKTNNVAYMFYNDQPPYGKDLSGKAHAKGFLYFEKDQGFWVVHSAPRFINPKTAYNYPDNARSNGQSFICITMKSESLEEIGKQLFVAGVQIIEKTENLGTSRVIQSAQHYFLTKVLKDDSLGTKTCKQYRVAVLASKGGQKFVSFQKHRRWQKDLYGDLLLPVAKKGFFIETWLNGKPLAYPPNCDTSNKMRNIRQFSPGIHSYPSSNDHSKLAISTEGKPGVVCFGDINRQVSQANRGGGTLCFSNKNIWEFMRKAVTTYECCDDEKGNSECWAGKRTNEQVENELIGQNTEESDDETDKENTEESDSEEDEDEESKSKRKSKSDSSSEDDESKRKRDSEEDEENTEESDSKADGENTEESDSEEDKESKSKTKSDSEDEESKRKKGSEEEDEESKRYRDSEEDERKRYRDSEEEDEDEKSTRYRDREEEEDEDKESKRKRKSKSYSKEDDERSNNEERRKNSVEKSRENSGSNVNEGSRDESENEVIEKSMEEPKKHNKNKDRKHKKKEKNKKKKNHKKKKNKKRKH